MKGNIINSDKERRFVYIGSEALASFDGTKVPAPIEMRYLVLDTKFFDMKFKYKLLSKFDNLDEVDV